MTRRRPPGALLAAYMAVANVVFWAAIIAWLAWPIIRGVL